MKREFENRPTSRNFGALRGLLPFIKPYRWLVVSAAIALVMTASLSLFLPIAVRLIIDSYREGHIKDLDVYFALAFGSIILLAICTGLRYYLVTRLGEEVIADIRRAVFERTIRMSPGFFDTILTGEVLSRLTTDTTLILAVIGSSASVALRNMLLFLGGMVLLCVTSAKLAAIVLLIVPLVLLVIMVMGRKLRRLSSYNQDWIARSSGAASEVFRNVQAVQAYSQEETSSKAFSQVTEYSVRAARQRISMRALMTVFVILLVSSGLVGVLWIGVKDVGEERMSMGGLVQFVIYSAMVGGAAAALSEIWGELQRAAGASERLSVLLSAEDPIKDPENPEAVKVPVEGRVRFEKVKFFYQSRPHFSVLTDVSFTIEPGETVALVGPSGAGKSTIFQLLFRFFDPQSGRILLDGQDIKTLLRSEFRKFLAFVPQEPAIFATSAEENIRFSKPEARFEEVEAAAKAANIDTFLKGLPEGYQSPVGEGGIMLSVGQKQRLAIARAILRQAPVLLLDEATSALDAESERAVQLAFERMREGRTSFIIAHRLATVKNADRILVLDGGRIIASGTHDDLIEQGGLYARLARLQFTDV